MKIFGNKNTDPLEDYKITDMEPTDGNAYYGYVNESGAWYIKHITDATIRYVRGISGYAAAWQLKDDPGTVYGYFDEVF